MMRPKINKDKKAFMKTVEVIIAVLVTFAFVISIIPETAVNRNTNPDNFLMGLENNMNFRSCVISEDSTCLDNIISTSIVGYYNYTYSIFDNYLDEPSLNLPQKEINTYSVVVSGNHSLYNPKIFKLYYWTK